MKNILITGDSISYNRYGFDKCIRINAWNCRAGMQSWSFRLRNFIISSAGGFRYADEFISDKNALIGTGTEDEDSVFGKRGRTVAPKDGKIMLDVKGNAGSIALYLQKRPEEYFRCNVSVDGKTVIKNLDTYGSREFYNGYELMTLELSCDKEKSMHEIIFSDFEYEVKPPKLTVAGVSNEAVKVSFSGQGSRTSKFFIYHFEERIAKYSPDMIIFAFGGNDIAFYSPVEYEENLKQLFRLIKEKFPHCRQVCIGLMYPRLDKRFAKTKKEWTELILSFNRAMKNAAAENGGIYIDSLSLFKNIPVSEWRFDNIHMTPKGNDILYEEVKKTVAPFLR